MLIRKMLFHVENAVHELPGIVVENENSWRDSDARNLNWGNPVCQITGTSL